jgi:DNA-directed RNA polymerase subunit omega
MKLVDGFDSNYRYVLVAARRARQLQNGARPVVQTHSRKPCRIAEEEIQAGLVKWQVPQPEKTPMEVASEALDGIIGGEADD